MNKSAIKGFSVRARRKLIEDISQKAYALGIKGTGKYDDIEEFEGGFRVKNAVNQIIYPLSTKKDREKLIAEINRKGFEQVIEEIAYTWFNRIIAIRFMEINEYLPVKVRMLSSEVEGKTEPDVITYIYDYVSELELDSEKVFNLKENHKDEELFKYVFVKECNNLGKLMPQVFEAIGDYTELLLPDQLLSSGSIIRDLVESIDESDFTHQVEIIGWLYQYYNEEKKDTVINVYKGVVKKNDIPAATQLFTTKWVVQYMVDNSLGRYWIERNPESKLKNTLNFFIEGKAQIYNEVISPEEIKFLDPCMGSGHILVYAFEVLMKIYEERGYSSRDAATKIITKNLFGLDIDDRAGQLASFSLMMSARKYDRNIFDKSIIPNTFAIQESNSIKTFDEGAEYLRIEELPKETANYLISEFKDAKEIGSIIELESLDYSGLMEYINQLEKKEFENLFNVQWFTLIAEPVKYLTRQAIVMSQQYHVVVTNPPYLNKFSSKLKEYLKANYSKYSSDLFSVFMFRNFKYCYPNGYSAFMTPLVWMYIQSYEELRNYILQEKSISSLIEMEYSAFEEATVPICSFVLQNSNDYDSGNYIKLSDFKGGMEVQKQKVVEALNSLSCDYLYNQHSNKFLEIPGVPIAYWINEKIYKQYNNLNTIGDVASVKKGLATGNVNLFIKYWHEVDINKISFNKNENKWYPCHKGGGFRKWYGNLEKVINWEADGYNIKNYTDENGNLKSRPQNLDYMFREGIAFSKITSSGSSCRIMTGCEMFDDAVQGIFASDNDKQVKLLGLLNSKIVGYFLNFLNPTMNKQLYDLKRIIAILPDNDDVELIREIISLSKDEWNNYENSWNFSIHPLLRYKDCKYIGEAFEYWEEECNQSFNKVKILENKLNESLIKKYGLEGDLISAVSDEEISFRLADRSRDIRSLVSYFVGVMFGRYSLCNDGIIHAGGEFDLKEYKLLKPVRSNILLLSGNEYNTDDVIKHFKLFLGIAFGEDTIENNFKYVVDSLDIKGNSSNNEKLRKYFETSFYNDHCSQYNNKPIYWMIDSGKQNGVKALFYLHRYDKSTIARFRTDYLHEIQRYYENDIELTEKSNDKKKVDNLKKKLQEVTEFDKVVAHIALKAQHMEFDLDDGVDHNYELFQGIEVPQGDGQKPIKADLLAKRK